MKRILRTFFVIFFPIVIIWVAITYRNFTFESENSIREIVSDCQMNDKYTKSLTDQYLSEIIQNINVVRDANEVAAYINDPADTNRKEMSAFFVRIMLNKQEYQELSFLDTKGNELVKILNDGMIQTVSTAELGNKSADPDFQKALELAVHGISVSDISVTRQGKNDALIKKASIEFHVPIYRNHSEYAGVISLKYNAMHLLELLKNQDLYVNQLNERFYVINQNGSYILAPVVKQGTSILYTESDKTMRSQSLLQHFNETGTGQITQNGITYVFSDVMPKVQISEQSKADKWILVHEIDTKSVMSISRLVVTEVNGRNGITVLVIVILSFLVSLFWSLKKKKENELIVAMKISESSNDAVMITDAATKITYVNHMYEAITGYRAEEVIGKNAGDFKSGMHDKEFYIDMWNTIRENGEWKGMLWDKKKDGLLYPKKMKIIATSDKNKNNNLHYVGIFSDLSNKGATGNGFETIEYKSGQLVLPNEDMMLELIKASMKEDAEEYVVLNISIENYNQLQANENDLEVSSIFISLLNPFIKEGDFIVQTGHNLYFAVILLKGEHKEPKEVLQRIYNELTKVISFNKRDFFFKIRVGVSCWPKDTNRINEILLQARIALEWSERHNETDITFFQENMYSVLKKENEIESYLKKAIERNEFHMVYQPQIEIATGRLVGIEGLIRWEQEMLGNISPAVFIPIAERNNMIIDIGYWIIERICRDLKEILDPQILNQKNFRCAINISSIQMEEGMFSENLFSRLEASEIPPERVELEITESCLMKNPAEHSQILKKFQDAGMSIAIDDFGTGYSSLSYLQSLPIDKIKIDRSFIQDYPDSSNGNLIQMLVEMVIKLGKTVLVEGAETKEQAEFLSRIGCDQIQGYYYAKPMLLSEINQKYLEQFTDRLN